MTYQLLQYPETVNRFGCLLNAVQDLAVNKYTMIFYCYQVKAFRMILLLLVLDSASDGWRNQ